MRKNITRSKRKSSNTISSRNRAKHATRVKFVKRTTSSPSRFGIKKAVASVSPFEHTSDDAGKPPRLQKVLASAGFGSRRACEELITAGRVEIDKQIVTELGVRVDVATQHVRVDGQSIRPKKRVYIALYKPKGFLCTHADQQGRKRAVDLLPENLGQVFPVGRLDMNSEGLLLLTNDGELGERLTHPRYGVKKLYRVLVAGVVTNEELAKLRRGIRVSEGILSVDSIIVKSVHKLSTVLDITLSEGRNREIRRMLAATGHKVMQLVRMSIGQIKLGKMVPGEWRHLSTSEVRQLFEQ
ncbi:MAG: rRNA pseudouridine synthase [Planctomycetaceae bacterium]|jgi:23S rRNA pseudouridine2605 synthase|nr:rRNA pseudouridine synthase [Planctomycetaceae bacterium]